MVLVENRGDRPGFVRMVPLPEVSQHQVESVVTQQVADNQRIRTDGAPVYARLPREGFTHENAPRSRKQADEPLPWAHLAISLAKRALLGTFHGVSHKYLRHYLSEFTYRFNRRWTEAELPFQLLNACVTTQTISHPELTG